MLSYIVSEHLFHLFPELLEGDLVGVVLGDHHGLLEERTELPLMKLESMTSWFYQESETFHRVVSERFGGENSVELQAGRG